MPSTVRFANSANVKESLRYKYDRCGNIAEITQNGDKIVSYAYDSLNRLSRENNKLLNKTVVFSYDTNGNILSRCEYPYTVKTSEELSELTCKHFDYIYEGDRLVKILSEDGEETFEYNNLGSPTTYRNKQLQWQYGKLLTQYGDNYFLYDGFGRRIRKNNIRYFYDSEGRLIYSTNGIVYVYDDKGLTGFRYNNIVYFYRKDAQGNIIAILDSNGAVVVRYEYDAWGNHKVLDADGNEITDPEHIGNKNPFRYRGYFYDVETGLYYLQTRYYDPTIGRFISQDSIDYADPETVNGINLYAYCADNPVMNVDPSGTSFWSTLRDIYTTVTGFFNPVRSIMAAGAVVVAMCQGKWTELAEDWRNGCFNPFNQNADVALNSNIISFYKGELVLRHSIKGATSCQIFGTIFLNTNEGTGAKGLIALNHEYGHGVQERLFGYALFDKSSGSVVNYVLCY